MVAGLGASYRNALDEPVYADPTQARDGPAITYPPKSKIFVPQAFRVLRCDSPAARLEDEESWGATEVRDGLGPFLLSYLSSPYSTESPLIILGHPGSGKSLLTEVLAARLATPEFQPIRVRLREVSAEDVQPQIEEQIRRETGRDINWADLADELAATPPVVILDGYDELLQASGRAFSDYLLRVRNFQAREAGQGRPVRAIVTSRVTLIDRARIPIGSTVLRLEDFDERRQSRWISRWNLHNRAYFDRSPDTEPFALPRTAAVANLARQPLLLMMLALFDSEGNALRRDEDIDQTLLYDGLLRRFIRREREKDDPFTASDPEEQATEIDADMRRLGVAALGMLNRATLLIHKDQLDKDIRYFDLERRFEGEAGVQLSQAELLLGSFFFVHESRSRADAEQAADEDEDTSARSAYEFLHKTFWEFLAADDILRRVIEQIERIGEMAGKRSLRGWREDLLSGRRHLDDDWFLSLLYRPLFGEPVVLQMMRDWRGHRCRQVGMSPDDFTGTLGEIVAGQLAHLLRGGAPHPIMTRTGQQPPPYEALPLLGHLATYGVNLVLLWAVLADDGFELDEHTIPADPGGGARPWDQLTHLWRSWFSLERLNQLAAVMDAERDAHIIRVTPKHRFATEASATDRLETVVSVADTIADDLLAGLAGVHAYEMGLVDDELDLALSRLHAEGIDLSLPAALRRARFTGRFEDAFRSPELYAEGLDRPSRAHKEALELAATPSAPWPVTQAARAGLRFPKWYQLRRVPDEIAVAYTHMYASLEPGWVRWAFSDLSDDPQDYARLAEAPPKLLAAAIRLGAVERDHPRLLELPLEVAVAALDVMLPAEPDVGSGDRLIWVLDRHSPLELLDLSLTGIRSLLGVAERHDQGRTLAPWLAGLADGDAAERFTRRLPPNLLLDVARFTDGQVGGADATHFIGTVVGTNGLTGFDPHLLASRSPDTVIAICKHVLSRASPLPRADAVRVLLLVMDHVNTPPAYLLADVSLRQRHELEMLQRTMFDLPS